MMVAEQAPSSHVLPKFVEEWSVERTKRAQNREQRAAGGDRTSARDPSAKARRSERREQRVAAGVEQLEIWLADIVRQGLAAARSQPDAFWAQMSARLIDAQAPGLARRVRALGDAAVSGVDWQGRLLAGLARLQLLIDAYRNLAQLPEGLASEVRGQIGWTQDRESLRSREGTRDVWQVLGLRQTEDEQLRTQRTWLRGERSGRIAMVLDFAPGEAPFPQSYQFGQRIDSELVYFDAASPLRALEKARQAALEPRNTLPAGADIASMQAAHAALLADNPWLTRWPVLLGPVTPLLASERLQLVDAALRRVSVRPGFRHVWPLLALAGGGALQLFGEWDGELFEPLTIECRGHLYTPEQLGELAVLSRVA
jgi:hypothetical protein